MEVCFGKPDDIDRWMDLVRRVRGNFPGLETEKDLEEHRQTILRFMEKRQALCMIIPVPGPGRIICFSRSEGDKPENDDSAEEPEVLRADGHWLM